MTEREWVLAIADAHGWQGEVIDAPAELLPEHLHASINTNQHLVLDSSRIRRELGYAERVPLGEALTHTIAWERANPPRDAAASAFDYDAEDAAIAAIRL